MLWIIGSLLLLWFVLDTLHLIARRDGVYVFENGLVDARGILGLQLTRTVRWNSVRSIKYERQVHLVNLIPYFRHESCEIEYLSDLLPDQPRKASLRLPGRTADLRRAVHLIRTRTGIAG